MQARVKILKKENVSGTSNKSGSPKDYNMDFAHFLDVDNFDKFRLYVSKEELAVIDANMGKTGVLDVSVNPKTDKLEFVGFKAAA